MLHIEDIVDCWALMKSLNAFVLVVNIEEIVESLAGVLSIKEVAVDVIFSVACMSIYLES